MKKLETKKSAVDLSDLAIGIVVLGVVVSIGITILVNMRDARLTDLSTFNVYNETITPVDSGAALGQKWFNGIIQILNQSGDVEINSGNYTVSTNPVDGTGIVTNISNDQPGPWNVSYSCYNSTRADFSLPNNASIGLGEYGNWFKILVIVGVATVVLSLIFLSFGRRGASSGIGGEY